MRLFTKAYVRMTEREGQAMTEYALILAAVAVVAIVAYQALGTSVSGQVNAIVNDL